MKVKMSNGINKRQNEEISLAMLASQRQLYNEVGKMNVFNIVLVVLLPILLTVIHGIFDPWTWPQFVSYGLSIATIFISILISKECKNKKTMAASVQLTFDTYVYQMPWDNKLFGKQRIIDDIVAEKSKKILLNEKETQSLKNWYPPIVDEMPLEDAIFICQRENYHWDVGLRKRYRTCVIITAVALAIIVFIIGLVNNATFQNLISCVVFIIPVIRWIASTINELNEDINRLKDLENEFAFEECKSKNMDDLVRIQKKITNHREAAVKIPNLFYRIFKDNDEDLEKKMIALKL